MSFLAPLWLFVGLLGAFVLLLHAHRRRKLVVSSTIFFAQLAKTEAARPELTWPKPSLPLVLQILAILFCALALARPVFDADGVGRHRVYLLDSSASMLVADMADGQSRFDAAVAKIAEDVAALDDAGEHLLSLFALGSSTEPLAVRYTSKAAFLSRLAAVRPQAGDAFSGDMESALSGIVRADELVETVLLSDNLALSFTPTQKFGFGAEALENASLSAQLIAGERAGQWSITGSVSYNTVQRPSEIRKQFKPHGGRSFIDLGALPLRGLRTIGDETKSLDFYDEITLPGPGILKLALPGDTASFDDDILLAVGPQTDEVRVLYLGQGEGTLSLAVAALDNLVVDRRDVLPDDLDQYDIVIAENTVLPFAPKTNTIWVGSARVSGAAEPQLITAASAVTWNGEHSLSRGLSVSELPAAPAYIATANSGETILLASNAWPLVTAATRAWGRELRLGFAADGAWARDAFLPVLLNRFVDWTGARLAPVFQCSIGEACVLPMSALAGPALGPEGETVFTPLLPETSRLPDAVTDGFVPKTAGIYTLSDGREVVVNATRLEPLERTLGETESVAHAGWPMWRWLLLAAMITLLTEVLIVGFRSDGFPRQAFSLAGRSKRWENLGLSLARLGAIAALVAAFFVLPGPGSVEGRKAIVISNTGDDLCAATIEIQAFACLREQDGRTIVAADQLHSAMQLALASLAPEQSADIALDWTEEAVHGSALLYLSDLQGQGAAIDLFPQGGENLGAFASFDLPEPIMAGDRFSVAANVFSPEAHRAVLTLTRDGERLQTQSLDLPQGWTRIAFDAIEVEAGAPLFALEWTSADGSTGEPHRIARIVEIAPAPSVAIITPHDGWGGVLAKALSVQNLAPEIISTEAAPEDIEGWLTYDAVILLNTPAIALSTAQQEQLEEFVRLHGGGLLLLGGENSFGPGGYYRTPLEELSPLSAHVPEERPVVALAFVLDRSGSMQADVSGLSRLEIAKQATLGAVDLLSDDSQVAVVVFDSEGHIVSTLAEKDMAALEAALASVTPGGGTYFTPGLDLGLQQLLGSDAPKRHMILMTDGVSQPGDFLGFAKAGFEQGISLSVVAIGSGTDPQNLAAIAEQGGGAFHSTEDFRALPSILSQEALMLDNEAMVPGTQPVRWVERDADFLQGLNAPLPPVQGFVKTSLKRGAALHLEALDADGKEWPVLASWQHGNGQVIAFATHGMGEGTAHWLDDIILPLLWGQAVRQSAQTASVEPPLVARQLDGEIAITSRDGLSTVRLTVDGGPWREIGLLPRADGTSGTTILARPGHYQFSAGDTEKDQTALSVSPLANPMLAKPDLAFLADLTGGSTLAVGEMPAPQWGIGFRPLWREWVLLGLAVLLAELTMRYCPGFFPWRFGSWKNKQARAAF